MLQPLSTWGMSSEVLLWQAIFLTILSFGVGVLGGTVGLALGTMRLPFMLLVGMPASTAGGTNILVSTLSAVVGSYHHIRERRVHWGAFLVQGVPATAGAFLGGLLAGRVPDHLLVALAGALVLWQGIELALRARRQATQAASAARPAPRLPWGAGRVGLEATAGLGIGLLGGAVGLILGSLRLPVLIATLKMDPRVAAGTNLAIGALMGSFGWFGHVVAGQVDYPLLVLMAATGMVGTYYGARLTGSLGLKNLLFLMAGVLLVVGGLLLLDAFRQV
ncbi:MAG: sulfite exporter TauE/SafE family protein [Chloroflexi bacterium]|nr:sulfite exporter TauE/SafE family protein [Chloroflexota bacterium]